MIDDIGTFDAYRKFSDLIPFFKSPGESVRSLMYLAMYHAGHGTPWPFHLISLIFHTGNVLLIYLIISKMINKDVAFITAIFSAVHPIFVEAVTWIAGSPYLEYSFFCLLSLYFYMQINSKKTRKNYYYLVATWISYVCATLFAPQSIVFPLILIVYELSFGSLKKNWLRFVPFIAVSCAWVLFYIPMAHTRIESNSAAFHIQKGLDNPLVQIPIAITSYIQLIFWPDKLTIYHSELRFSTLELVLRGIGLLGFLGLIVYLFRKNKMLFFWLSWFVISLLVTLMPMRLSWVYAERYVYLGAQGFLVITALGIYQILKKKTYRTLGILLILGITTALIIRTYIRNQAWKSEDDLWLATADASPSDFKTHNNVGTVYLKRGDVARAEREFIIAISMNKHYPDALYNLGFLYMNYNVFDRAEKFYLMALKENPKFWQAYNGLSIVYLSQKDFKKGEEFAKKTIELNPREPNGYNNLGLAYQMTNRRNLAVPNFEKALEINPNLWQTYFNLAVIYYLENNPQKVDYYMQQGFKHGEESAIFYNRLAQVYIAMKRNKEAKAALEKSLQLNPSDAAAKKAYDSL